MVGLDGPGDRDRSDGEIGEGEECGCRTWNAPPLLPLIEIGAEVGEQEDEEVTTTWGEIRTC